MNLPSSEGSNVVIVVCSHSFHVLTLKSGNSFSCGLKTSSYKTSIAKKVDFSERTTRTYNMLEQVVVPKCQQFFLTKNERTTVSKVDELFSQMG